MIISNNHFTLFIALPRISSPEGLGPVDFLGDNGIVDENFDAIYSKITFIAVTEGDLITEEEKRKIDQGQCGSTLMEMKKLKSHAFNT